MKNKKKPDKCPKCGSIFLSIFQGVITCCVKKCGWKLILVENK